MVMADVVWDTRIGRIGEKEPASFLDLLRPIPATFGLIDDWYEFMVVHRSFLEFLVINGVL